jgi:predicted transcriptional regulator
LSALPVEIDPRCWQEMAEHTVKTDIIISIHPKHVSNIFSRVKDHEYRNYLIPSSVQRIWIYERSPTSAIKYVAQISQGKRPGEIINAKGLLNAEFNEGKLEDTAKYAYEILDLHATPYPWTLQELKAKGWLNDPPQKYCYIRESMMAALRDIALTELLVTLTVQAADVGQAAVSETMMSNDDYEKVHHRIPQQRIKTVVHQSRSARKSIF